MPNSGIRLPSMGNDLADAIREVLRNDLIAEYGTLEAAAEAVGVPYKTLYRALTTRGKDRSQSVKLEFVLDIARHLEREGRSSFASVYSRAETMVHRAPSNVTPFPRRNVGPSYEDLGEVAAHTDINHEEDHDDYDA